MKKKLIIIAVVITLFLLILGASNDSETSKTANQEPAQNTTIQKEEPAVKPEYEVGFHEVLPQVENYEVVVKPNTDGKSVAEYIQKQCQKDCNIYVYDDTKAQKLDREYADIGMGENANMDGKAIIAAGEAWKKNNYVYVADHLIGNIDFSTKEWQAYPYRDSVYRELGGTQSN